MHLSVHSQTTGQVETVTTSENGDIIVAFKTRAAAEQVRTFPCPPSWLFHKPFRSQGLAKGSSIPTAGTVQISWFSGQPSSSPTTVPSASSTDVDGTRVKSPAPTSSRQGEVDSVGGVPALDEEVVASGWGAEDEEDGMGML